MEIGVLKITLNAGLFSNRCKESNPPLIKWPTSGPVKPDTPRPSAYPLISSVRLKPKIFYQLLSFSLVLLNSLYKESVTITPSTNSGLEIILPSPLISMH